jgi:hypothetical protein
VQVECYKNHEQFLIIRSTSSDKELIMKEKGGQTGQDRLFEEVKQDEKEILNQ